MDFVAAEKDRAVSQNGRTISEEGIYGETENVRRQMPGLRKEADRKNEEILCMY